MDEEIEQLMVSVRADTRGFAQDVAAMRGQLDGPLADGLDRAGRTLERSLSAAIQRGKFGFDDLRRVALSALADIASAMVQGGINSVLGKTAQGGNGGLLGNLASAALGLLGAPGRATGGPVAPGRAYRVGEQGPEWFVPTSSGRVETGNTASGSAITPVSLTIHVSDHGRGSAPDALGRSARQVARAVRGALMQR